VTAQWPGTQWERMVRSAARRSFDSALERQLDAGGDLYPDTDLDVVVSVHIRARSS